MGPIKGYGKSSGFASAAGSNREFNKLALGSLLKPAIRYEYKVRELEKMAPGPQLAENQLRDRLLNGPSAIHMTGGLLQGIGRP